MNLTEWAKTQGIDRTTAYRWFRNGVLPVRAQKVGPRIILVFPEPEQPKSTEKVALYARVSSTDQKSDLEKQLQRLKQWASSAGLNVVKTEAEVASGMNARRSKLRSLLSDASITVIAVEHRDRFARMDSELIEATLSAQGRRLAVIDPNEVEDDLVRDMVEVLTSFCARLYGKRSARNRALKALKCAESEE